MTIVYIISAPSGSGKSTLVNELRKSVRNLDFSVSYTTRSARGSEQNGHEYFFISRPEFERLLAQDAFLEHAEVFPGKYYGTAKRFLEGARERGHDLLLDIDVQGERQVKGKIPDAVSIFILPPNRKELERRLRRRSQAEGMSSEEDIHRRLETARKEIENYGNYDYILVNDQLEQSIDELKAIVLAERVRRSGGPRSPEQEKWLVTAERHKQANIRKTLEPILESFALSAIPGGIRLNEREVTR
ncbi:MAG TPA: guanylate kinase [Terriglobales bacterium]|jgi:guanylate kinase|nr:guanylate kinase [Terriglobales bacterium]